MNRPESARFSKNLAHPFSDGHALSPGEELNTRHLFVRQKNLQSLTHSLSITLSGIEPQGALFRRAHCLNLKVLS